MDGIQKYVRCQQLSAVTAQIADVKIKILEFLLIFHAILTNSGLAKSMNSIPSSLAFYLIITQFSKKMYHCGIFLALTDCLTDPITQSLCRRTVSAFLSLRPRFQFIKCPI